MFKDSAIASIEFILTCNTLLPTLGAEAEITLECCKIKSKFNKCCMPQIKEVLLQIIFLEGAPKLNEQRAIFKTLQKFFFVSCYVRILTFLLNSSKTLRNLSGHLEDINLLLYKTKT